VADFNDFVIEIKTSSAAAHNREFSGVTKCDKLILAGFVRNEGLVVRNHMFSGAGIGATFFVVIVQKGNLGLWGS
jgi:hypothetical protein